MEATSYTASFPATGTAGVAITITITLTPAGATKPSPVNFTLTDGGAGGTFGDPTPTLPAGQTQVQTTYVRPTAGTSSITAGAIDAGLADPPPASFVALAAATSYTLSGPTTGVVGVASGPFTVAPDGAFTGTITPATTGGGTFAPPSLSWSGTSEAKSFTYTPATAGTASISASDNAGLADPTALVLVIEARARRAKVLWWPGLRR